MNLPKFRSSKMILSLFLVIVILLAGGVFWFSRIPAYQRPFGLASTCVETQLDAETDHWAGPGVTWGDTNGGQWGTIGLAVYYWQSNGLYCGTMAVDAQLTYHASHFPDKYLYEGYWDTSLSNSGKDIWLSPSLKFYDIVQTFPNQDSHEISVNYSCTNEYATSYNEAVGTGFIRHSIAFFNGKCPGRLP
jgi:hypothetical protein